MMDCGCVLVYRLFSRPAPILLSESGNLAPERQSGALFQLDLRFNSPILTLSRSTGYDKLSFTCLAGESWAK